MADADPAQSVAKPFIRAMPPAGQPPIQRDSKSGIDPSKIRRMNLNESPFPPSPKAIAAMQEAATRVNYYPDPLWRDLTSALAAHTGHPQNRIVLANGSDELIVAAGRIVLSPGDEVLVPLPSFPSYNKAAAVNGATLVTVKVRQDGSADTEGMLAAVTDKTRIVFLATPNNPTGGILTTEEVVSFVKALPPTTLLVLDEAYYEYGIYGGGSDHLAAMAEVTNVPWVAFRTFSKAYGLAGMRVGYGLCGSEEVAGWFQKVRSTFNVNAVAQAGALAALGDQEHMRSIVERTFIERQRLEAGLAKLGCESFPSVGNYLSSKTPKPAGEVVAEVEKRGIMIGRLMVSGYEDYIRITTGRAEDTDALLEALAEVLA